MIDGDIKDTNKIDAKMTVAESVRASTETVVAAHHYIGDPQPRPLCEWQTKWYQDARDAFLCLGQDSFLIRYCNDDDQHVCNYNDETAQVVETTEEMIQCVRAYLAVKPINIFGPSSIIVEYMGQAINPDFVMLRQSPNTLPALIKHVYAMQCSKAIDATFPEYPRGGYHKISCMMGQLLNGLFFVYTFVYKGATLDIDFEFESSLVVARKYSTLLSHGFDLMEDWHLEAPFTRALTPVRRPVVRVREHKTTIIMNSSNNTETKAKTGAMVSSPDTTVSFELVVPTMDGRKRSYQSLHMNDLVRYEPKSQEGQHIRNTKRHRTEIKHIVLDTLAVESKNETEIKSRDVHNWVQTYLYHWFESMATRIIKENDWLSKGNKRDQLPMFERMILATISTMSRDGLDPINQFIVLDGCCIGTVTLYLCAIVCSQFINMEIAICCPSRDISSAILKSCRAIHEQLEKTKPSMYAKRIIQARENILSFRKREFNKPYDTSLPAHQVSTNNDYWSIRAMPFSHRWLQGSELVPDILLCVDMSAVDAHAHATQIKKADNNNNYSSPKSLLVCVTKGVAPEEDMELVD